MLESLFNKITALQPIETPTQKFSCRFFQIFTDYISLQSNSGRVILTSDPILQFKIQIVLKSKLTLEKCVFASVTFLFLFLLASKEGELCEYKSN